MAENGLNHLVYHENGETGGYDNEAFNHHHPEKLKRKKSIEDRERHTVTPENGHLPASPTNCLTNGHDADHVVPASPTLTNGSAVVVLDSDDSGTQNCPQDSSLEELNVNLNVDTGKELKCPLDTKLRHYVPLDNEGKMLNSEDELRIAIPDDAIINFNTGRIRIQNQQNKSHSPLPKSCHVETEEKIPMQDMSCTLPQEDSEKALEAAQNGRTSEEYSSDTTCNEKQGNGAGPFDEYFIPVNTRKKYLRGEKLYLTKDSKQLCQNWRRVIICGLIAIVVAVAILVGVLAATGILLAESESKTTRHEINGHSLPDTASIALAGKQLPRPSKVPQKKYLPPTTVSVPESTTSFSQSVPEVTPIVPVVQPNSSQSHTIVPNALVGEFTIVDENYTYDLSDQTSNGYLSLATQLETELSKIFEASGGHFQELKILKFRPGSIIVRFVVIWENEHGVILAKRAYQIVKEYLKKNNNLIASYQVKGSSLNFIDVIDECRVQNGGCMHDCEWSYQNLTKTCICQNNMELMPDGKSCVEREVTSEKEALTVDVSSTEMSTSVGISSENEPEITTITTKAETVFVPGEITVSTSLVPQTTDLLIADTTTMEPTVDSIITTSEASTTVSSEILVSQTIGTTDGNEIITFASIVTTAEENVTTIPPLEMTMPQTFAMTTTQETNTNFVSDEASTTAAIDTTEASSTVGTFQTNTTVVGEDQVTTVPTTIKVDEIVTSSQPHTIITNDEISTQFSTDTADDFTTFSPNLETTISSNTDVSSSANENNGTVSTSSVSVSTLPFASSEETTVTTVPLLTESNVDEHTTYTNSKSTKELSVPAIDSTTPIIYVTTESDSSVMNESSTDNSTHNTLTVTMQPINEVTDNPTHETSVSAISTSTLPTTIADESVVVSTPLNFTNKVNRTPEVRFFNNESDFMPTDLNFHSSSTEKYEGTVLVTTDLNTGDTTTSSVMTTTLKPKKKHHRHHTTTEHTEIHLIDNVTHTTSVSSDLNSTESVTDALTESSITETSNASLVTQNPETSTTTTFINAITTPIEFIDIMHNESYTNNSTSATTPYITANPNNFVNTTMESTISATHNVDISGSTIENEGSVTAQNNITDNSNNTLPENSTISSNSTDLGENVTTPTTTDSLSEVSTESVSREHLTDVNTVSVTEQTVTTTLPDFELSTMEDSDVTNLYSTFDEFSKFSTEEDYDLSNSTLDDTTLMNVTEGIQCREDQFLCSSLNLCLNNSFMCDGIEDCPDGLDESECTETCNLNFKCENSSVCIMSDAHCDGIWDCTDGSDEQNCTPSECAKHEVMCLDGSTCIKPGHICDWKYNCRDRSDEVGCVERTTCETGGRFFCNDGLCIPWSLKCDGNYDCKDKEDEGNCTCLEDEFKCNDGKCLKSSMRCDGHRDCINAEDELGCVNVDDNGMVILHESYSSSSSLLCADDWTLDDGHYLCQELGFGHALFTNATHVSFEGSWMAMKRINVTSSSLWTERVTYAEKCSSNLAAGVVCQKIECGNYSGLLHRRKKRQSDGLSSSTTQWPFIAYVSTSHSSKGCVSEILTPVWLITSAECLLSIGKEPHNGSDWYVRTNVAKGFNSDIAQKHEVLKIVLHPHSSKFRSLILRDYDVALIRLKHALVFSDKIGAICLPEEQVPSGITCFSGVLGTERPRAPPPLFPTFSSLAMMVLDRDSCNVPDHYNDQINNRMLCTKSSDSQSVCDNDEGTPLMCLSGINKWYLAGMLSYQRLCGVYNWHPAVFSNLFAMRNYIDQVIGQRQYGTKYDNTIYTVMPSTTTGSSTTTEVTTEPMLTTESQYETTLTTPVDTPIASGRLSDQQFDSTMNETYANLETTTVYLINTEETEASNVTEEVRMVKATEFDELLTTELSDHNTSDIATTTTVNLSTEETHVNTSEFASLSDVHESLPLKQPQDSESDTNADMLKDSPRAYDNTEISSDSTEHTTTISGTEDFIVETLHPNLTEQHLGYVSLTNIMTLVPENITQMDSLTVATVTVNETSENSSTNDTVENVSEDTTEISSYQHAPSEDTTEVPSDQHIPSPSKENRGFIGLDETTNESRIEHNSTLQNDSISSDTGDMEMIAGNFSNNVTLEDEHDTATVSTFHVLGNGSDKISTNQSDMLVKEFIVKSRNIDIPLKFSVTNSTIVVEEVKPITYPSSQGNNSLSDVMHTDDPVSTLFKNITGTLITEADMTQEDDFAKSQESNATIKYNYSSTNQDTTTSETIEFSTVQNVTEYQNSTTEVTTNGVHNDDSSSTTLH